MITVWATIPDGQPADVRTTIDDLEAMVDAGLGHLVWPVADHELRLLENGFKPDITPRIARLAQRWHPRFAGADLLEVG